MSVHLHSGDLPDGVAFGPAVAVDSEAMGLRLHRDALTVVQLSAGDGDAHVVQLLRPAYDAPNLKRLMTDPGVLKIFHFGRFDIAMFQVYLGVDMSKAQQSSDWGPTVLTPEQQAYAASDVLNLHGLKTRLDAMLEREGREGLAQACFDFLPARARLDAAGWDDVDIFAHS